MGFIEDFTPEQIKAAGSIGDRASAAIDTYSELEPSSRARVAQALSKDPPSTDGLDGDAAATKQVTEEIAIRKAKIEFMNSVGFDIDPVQSFDAIFKDTDGNINSKNVQRTNDLLQDLVDAQTKDPSFLDKIKTAYKKKAEDDPKNSSKYGTWAAAIAALASAASALLAFLKNKLDLDALRDALKAIAAAMSGCFAVDVVNNTNKLLSCDKGSDDSDQKIIAALQAACTNTTYQDLSGKCTDYTKSMVPPTFTFVYKTYTVGDLLADALAAVANIPKDIGRAFTWVWTNKWYILAVIVLMLAIAFVTKRYILSDAHTNS